MQAHLEELRTQSFECEQIRDFATEPKKREQFDRLAQHHRVLVAGIEPAIAEPMSAPQLVGRTPSRSRSTRSLKGMRAAPLASPVCRKRGLTFISGVLGRWRLALASFRGQKLPLLELGDFHGKKSFRQRACLADNRSTKKGTRSRPARRNIARRRV